MFYLHIADDGFAEPPWPGERRLGPFETAAEAEAQAVNDVAIGALSEADLIGVYDEAGSRDRHESLMRAYAKHDAGESPWDPVRFDPRLKRGGKSQVPAARIKQKAAKVREGFLADAARSANEHLDTLRHLLPPGMDAETFMRATVAESPPNVWGRVT